MPLAWDELSVELKSSRYTVANALERLKRLKRDPWEEYWRTGQTIPADTTAALDALSGIGTARLASPSSI